MAVASTKVLKKEIKEFVFCCLFYKSTDNRQQTTDFEYAMSIELWAEMLITHCSVLTADS